MSTTTTNTATPGQPTVQARVRTIIDAATRRMWLPDLTQRMLRDTIARDLAAAGLLVGDGEAALREPGARVETKVPHAD